MMKRRHIYFESRKKLSLVFKRESRPHEKLYGCRTRGRYLLSTVPPHGDHCIDVRCRVDLKKRDSDHWTGDMGFCLFDYSIDKVSFGTYTLDESDQKSTSSTISPVFVDSPDTLFHIKYVKFFIFIQEKNFFFS